jgi:hypothetical protein
MLASSGEATAPCGVPTFVSDHSPSSDTPAFSHFWISADHSVGYPMPMNFTSHSCDKWSKKPSNVGIENPVHFFRMDPPIQRIQRMMRLRPGRNP